MGARSIGLSLLLAGACGDSGVTSYQDWELEDLQPEQGLSLRTPEFEVAAGSEIQDCYFFELPDLGGGDLWVDRVLTAINPGSHHMNVFRVRTVVGLDPYAGEEVDLGGGVTGRLVRGGAPGEGECWKSANWADWPLVTNSQKSGIDDPYSDWVLPQDVAIRFTAGETLMLQTHYVNATTQTTPFRGRVGLNLYRTAVAEPIELGTLFATQQSIRICRSNPQPTFAGTCAFPAGTVTITAANGHFHSRGQRFQIFEWDGVTAEQPSESAMFYESDRWDDPPMVVDIERQPPANGGVWWTCEYQWLEPDVGCAEVDARDPQMAGDCCYTFGPTVETSEHCNVFIYFYPKVDRGDIFCN